MLLLCYTDINECLVGNGGCEHNCTNLEGISSTTGLGYQCGCDDGYQLAANNHDCKGRYIYVAKWIETMLMGTWSECATRDYEWQDN